jgi:hypothetical protein
MLPFRLYSHQGVDPHIQTVRAVWPAKPKGGYVTDKPSDAPSPSGDAAIGVDAVIQSKQPSISGSHPGDRRLSLPQAGQKSCYPDKSGLAIWEPVLLRRCV